MSKRLSYLIAQGQGGVRSGIALGIPFKVDNAASAANGAIPAASFPLETAIYIVPDRIVADAFNSIYMDANPAANEPAVTVAVQAIRVAFNAAFAAAAASFVVTMRRFTSAGGLVGAVATLVDGTVTTLVANAQILIAQANIANMPMNVGDVLTTRIVIAGAGAPCPAFGGTVDAQG